MSKYMFWAGMACLLLSTPLHAQEVNPVKSVSLATKFFIALSLCSCTR